MNFWVQQRGEILGPFDWEELQQMAAARKVRPDDKVSTDQHQWVIASRVPGLMSLKQSAHDPTSDAALDDETKQFRAALADEDQFDDDEYRLSPEVAPRPAEVVAQSEPEPTYLPVGARKTIEVPQQSLGMALGGLAAVVLIVLALPTALILDAATGGHFGTIVAVLSVLVVIAAAGFFIAAAMGSSNTLEMRVTSPGVVHVMFSRRVAYLCYSRWEGHVASGDRLQQQIKMQLGMFSDATVGDIATLLLLASCCGGLPGALIWMYGFQSGGESMCGYQLLLFTRENPAPVTLYSEKITEYFATRFGPPTPAENMIKWLQSAVPDLVVAKVEV